MSPPPGQTIPQGNVNYSNISGEAKAVGFIYLFIRFINNFSPSRRGDVGTCFQSLRMKEKKENGGHALPEGKWHVAGQSGVGLHAQGAAGGSTRARTPNNRARNQPRAHPAREAGGPAQRTGSRPLPLNAPPSTLGPAPGEPPRPSSPKTARPRRLSN